jgi:FKBP-type peptidyl-prolyl cis-trans isomerase
MKFAPQLLLFLIMSACSTSSTDGFTELGSDIRYKLVMLGDETRPCKGASHVSFRLSVLDSKDSCIAVRHYNRIQPTDQRLSDERMLADAELGEQLLLQKLKDSLQLSEAENVDGIYYRSVKAGHGKKPYSGALLTVHYTAHFADGRLFDDTYQGHALQYQCGKPDQVLPGFAVGIAQMQEGAEAIFVIPSYMAFGELGSTSGIVPPFSTLVYQVRLTKVGV